jgi:predicted MPP superfamily phosphohydrolase
MKEWTRRDWLKRGFATAGATAGAGAGCVGYGSLIEKQSTRLERVTCPLIEKHRHLDGIKIGMLADLHFDEYGDAALVHRAVQTINREQVDVVMLAGDFVSHKPEALEPLGEILRDLRARIGVFAILGNHDHWMGSHHAVSFLRKAGIRLLRNETEDLGDFVLAGLESAWGGKPDHPKVLSSVKPEKPVILGWHEPDTFDWYSNENVILQLSGHTHGGQICAPILGPLILPHLGRKYPSGLFARQSSHLYVTRGLGVITIPARFCCPPEVSVIELKYQDAGI